MIYDPIYPGLEVTPTYIYEELQRIASAMRSPSFLEFETLNTEPLRPTEGMMAKADGTNWNPGAGAGFYGYVSGAWVKL